MRKNTDAQVLEEVEKSNNGISKGVAALAIMAIASAPAFAAMGNSSDSFGQLLSKFEGWLSGNLGKLLALLGFIGTFIIYLMTHKGSVLFVGIVISLIAGGISGITETFFNAGTDAFTAV